MVILLELLEQVREIIRKILFSRFWIKIFKLKMIK